MPIGLLSVSGFTPERVIDNSQISHWSDASEEWITRKTGIHERRYAGDDMAVSHLAANAARPLLPDDEARDKVALLIVATATPDQPQPATACFVQETLGLGLIPAFDVSAVCSGYLYGLVIAEALLSGRYRGSQALVIGADKFSAIMDRTDRRTVSLFGDGAGATLVGPVPDGYGIHGSALAADGKGAALVRVEAGGSRQPLTGQARDQGGHRFRMDGRGVTAWAERFVPQVVHQAAEQAGWGIDAIDRAVFHQGNVRLVQALGKTIGIPESKLAFTAPEFGNTAGAAVPLTLAEEHGKVPFQRGERILLASVGGGMTAGAVALTWY
jgi:3-oxoacyl-[acyl-carrier-protein] synthase-3